MLVIYLLIDLGLQRVNWFIFVGFFLIFLFICLYLYSSRYLLNNTLIWIKVIWIVRIWSRITTSSPSVSTIPTITVRIRRIWRSRVWIWNVSIREIPVYHFSRVLPVYICVWILIFLLKFSNSLLTLFLVKRHIIISVIHSTIN
jgi:hypothetical protein